jgi:hypothetical protein
MYWYPASNLASATSSWFFKPGYNASVVSQTGFTILNTLLVCHSRLVCMLANIHGISRMHAWIVITVSFFCRKNPLGSSIAQCTFYSVKYALLILCSSSFLMQYLRDVLWLCNHSSYHYKLDTKIFGFCNIFLSLFDNHQVHSWYVSW